MVKRLVAVFLVLILFGGGAVMASRGYTVLNNEASEDLEELSTPEDPPDLFYEVEEEDPEQDQNGDPSEDPGDVQDKDESVDQDEDENEDQDEDQNEDQDLTPGENQDAVGEEEDADSDSKRRSIKTDQKEAWIDSGAQGPPPWANENALMRTAWVRSGEEGPPPWSNARANRLDGEPEPEDERAMEPEEVMEDQSEESVQLTGKGNGKAKGKR